MSRRVNKLGKWAWGLLPAALLAAVPGPLVAQDGQFDLRTRSSPTPTPEPTVVGPVDPDTPAVRARPRPAPTIVLPPTEAQPVPKPRDKVVPATISGRGADVVKIRAEEDLQPIVTSTHRGQSNFIVHLIGYGDTSGEQYLVNEIGNYSGETIVENMPAGSYLLWVQADGPWTIKFSP